MYWKLPKCRDIAISNLYHINLTSIIMLYKFYMNEEKTHGLAFIGTNYTHIFNYLLTQMFTDERLLHKIKVSKCAKVPSCFKDLSTE